MQISYITIFINGEAFNCYKEMSLQDLLEYLNFDFSNIVVEYNQEIISSDKFCHISFSDQDKIEVITIVGGG